jgi:hypothetical protein
MEQKVAVVVNGNKMRRRRAIDLPSLSATATRSDPEMKGMRSRSVYSDEMNDAAARRCHVEEAATPRPLSLSDA